MGGIFFIYCQLGIVYSAFLKCKPSVFMSQLGICLFICHWLPVGREV